MGSPAAQENMFLLYSVIMGVYITFLYDLLRIGRRVIAHNGFWVSVEDLAFWIYCAMKVFYLMHAESDGTLRWFAILGALLGMFLYKKTISPFFVKWVSFGLQSVLHFIAKPFQFVAKQMKKILRKVTIPARRKMQAGRERFKNKLTSQWKLLKISIKKQ